MREIHRENSSFKKVAVSNCWKSSIYIMKTKIIMYYQTACPYLSTFMHMYK